MDFELNDKDKEDAEAAVAAVADEVTSASLRAVLTFCSRSKTFARL